MSHAIVIGGSVAGLLAARVLLNHFEQVTLVERDHFPLTPAMRPGIPQAQHVHALLIEGYRILEDLFPNLTGDLTEKGALLMDWTQDWRVLTVWDWMPQEPCHTQGLICSRMLLEWYLLDRLRQRPGFEIREATQVMGLMAAGSPSLVIGVTLTQDGNPQALDTDWVVDASGRNSKLADWLVDLGYQCPPKTTVNSFLGYASRWYRQPVQGVRQGIILAAKPGVTRRGGVLYPVEGDRCVITLSGIEKDHPPSDEAGFLAFADSLRHPSIADAIRDYEPISSIQCYRRTENQWRHYEKLPTMPDGVVALGDAVCAFNPVYGQGMTVAALGATLLDRCLQHPRRGLALHFQRQLAKTLTPPWLMATSEDLRWPLTTGDRPGWLSQQLQHYFDRVARTANHDPKIQFAFLKVPHLAKPPIHLLRPRTLWKALTLQTSPDN